MLICRLTKIFFTSFRRPLRSSLFPYTTLFRSETRRPPGGASPKTAVVRPSLEQPVQSVEVVRSEEHTSELQSHSDLVCRLLLEKKKLIQLLTLWVCNLRIIISILTHNVRNCCT